VTMMRKVALIALAGLLVVVAGWYMVFWRSESSHLKALKAQESKAAANVSQLEMQLGGLRVLQREVPAEKAALNKLNQDIPQGPSLDELLDVINRAASTAGVSLASISTPEPSGWSGAASGQTAPSASGGSGPQTMTLSISVDGNNNGLLRFITALDSAPRLFVVDDFSLNSSSQTSTGATGLTVETYYVSSASGDPASDYPLTKVSAVVPQPAQPSAPATHMARVKTDLTAHSHR
jgi:Tfp pilus assembly protein PilO